MSKKNSESNIEPAERRKHWRDRRKGDERRSPQRLKMSAYDCRSGQPRRSADVSGELSDGEIWWHKSNDAAK